MLGWITSYLANRKQRVVLGRDESEYRSVTSGVPQGSVLGPVLFLIYVNDIFDGVHSLGKLFADDAKLYMRINNYTDSQLLQKDLDTLTKWTDDWLLSFNESKCSVLHFGANNNLFNYTLHGQQLDSPAFEKDLGVHISTDLKSKVHIGKITAKANSILGLIRSTFRFLDVNMMKSLYLSLIRPHLEYAAQIWSPHYQYDIDKLESIQKRATKMPLAMRDKDYESRLRFFDMPTLQQRRSRGDLIQTFKIFNEVDDLVPSRFFALANQDPNRPELRGHPYKILKQRFQGDIRKNFYTCRVIDSWNKLPGEVVESPNLSIFKKRLDKFLSNRGVYNDEL